MTDQPPTLAAEPSAAEEERSAADVLIRGGLVRTLGYVVAAVANALALPFLFRHLGVDQAGQYVTVMSYITILAGVVEIGLTGISLRHYAIAADADKPEVMRQIMTMRLLILAGGSALTFAFLFATGSSSTVLTGVALGVVAVLLENIGSTYNVWLTNELRLGWLTITNVARQLVAASLTLAGVAAGLSLNYFFLLLIPASLTQAVLSYVSTRGRIPHLPSLHLRQCVALLRTSVPFVAAMALGFVYFRVPMILLSLLGTATQTGYFGAAFRLVETLSQLGAMVLSAVTPILTRAARDDSDRHRAGVAKLTATTLVLGGALTMATAAGAPLAIAVIAGPAFDKSTGLVVILSGVLLLKFVSTGWSLTLASTGQFRDVLYANAAAAALAVFVAAITIPRIGAYGAAIATVEAEILLAAIYRYQLRSIPFPRHTAIGVLAALAAGSLCFAFPVPDIAQFVIGIVLYVAVVTATRSIPEELLSLLPLRR